MLKSLFQRRALQFLAILTVLFYLPLAGLAEHTDDGTDYGDEGVATYAQTKHGPDGAVFLDPYFMPFLLNLEGQVVLDAGCGAGPWSILAAQNGAFVYGIDLQEGMIEKAKQAAIEAGVEDSTVFVVGDVNHLPYGEGLFDRAFSINVGCNLPALKFHLEELNRVLKKGGIAIITAPSSFGTVFSDGLTPYEELVGSIDRLLIDHQDAVPQILQGLDNVFRATFAKREDQWILVSDEALLESGEAIWRKIPSMVVPNYYHSVDEYLALISASHFCVRHIYQPHFLDEQAREDHNKDQKHPLGKEYVSHSPFTIFVIEKL